MQCGVSSASLSGKVWLLFVGTILIRCSTTRKYRVTCRQQPWLSRIIGVYPTGAKQRHRSASDTRNRQFGIRRRRSSCWFSGRKKLDLGECRAPEF